MHEMLEVSKKIKSLAKAKGILVKDMLNDCDLGINAISEMSKGKSISAVSLAKIADHLDCTVDYLLGRTNDPQVELIPADPNKVHQHQAQLNQQQEELFQWIIDAIKKAAPGGEQPFDDETLEFVLRFYNLPPEDRDRAKDFLGVLSRSDKP